MAMRSDNNNNPNSFDGVEESALSVRYFFAELCLRS